MVQVSPLIAFFLGLLVPISIFLIFWVFALLNPSAADAFEGAFCEDLANQI